MDCGISLTNLHTCSIVACMHTFLYTGEVAVGTCTMLDRIFLSSTLRLPGLHMLRGNRGPRGCMYHVYGLEISVSYLATTMHNVSDCFFSW